MTHGRLVTIVALAATAVGCSPPAGTSPAAPTVLAISGATNSNPSVASDGPRAVVAWIATTETQSNLYAATSVDGGETFAPPVRVNAVDGDARPGGEQAPRIALLPRESIALTWNSTLGGTSRIKRAISTDGGRTFVNADASTAADPGARGWASLAADPSGQLHTVWLDVKSPDRASPRHAATHAMKQNVYHAAWTGQQTITETQIASNVCFCCKTAVAVASDGRIFAAWRNIYPTNLRDIAVAASSDGGRTFSKPTRVSEDGWQIDACPEDGPALALNGKGDLVIVWPTVIGDGRKALFYSVSTDGGQTFAKRRRLDEAQAPAIASHPQLTAAGGRVIATWDQTGSDARQVWIRDLSDADAPGAPRRVDDGRRGNYPSVAIGSRGTIVAWASSTGDRSQILLRRLPN